ncbi:tripartite motif containing 35-28 [Salarias fasciatus]|uniref:Nuclear factor 7, brain-like n=1 Tax=Salarias fasciatus TaxID=181472 RepID=A0A672FDI0_SALFA|nr:nuclear factor 7, brain-like [Salarias fasciatus]
MNPDDMDDSEDSSPFQQELTCPVCQGIFRDPVLLACSHSFCRECLDKSFDVNNKCPVCREVYHKDQAITNRALSSTCERFLQETNRWPKQQKPPQGEGVCNLHLRPLELYCEKDEEPVCVDCVSLHSSHRIRSIGEGVRICKEELDFKIQIFQKKVETYKKMSKKFSNATEHIKRQAEQAEKHIRAEFDRLRELLDKEEQQRLLALTQEEEQKIKDLHELAQRTKEDITAVKGLIDMVKKEMGNEDLPFLKNFQALKRKAEWTKHDPDLENKCVLNMGSHVGALGYKIWKSIQGHIRFYPVVLDPNTASPWLSLSDDLTMVKESAERITVPDNPERFDPCVFVLGSEGYISGKHKWDVLVGDSPKWVLGVCSHKVTRKKKFTVSTNREVWSISLSKGVYTVMTPKRTELQLQRRPEKIRIKLNMEKGEVSFWDGGTGKHLVTLTHDFTQMIFPLFGPGLHSTPMTLAPGKMAVHTS